MYIKHVQGSIKSGVDTELGYRTLIVGPNGSGKSSIINALELVLCGYATDIAGRAIVKKTTDLMTLSNDEAGLKVEAETDTGHTISYAFRRDGDRIKRPTHRLEGLHATLPFMDVREHLTGSASKAKTYLLGWVSNSLLDKDIYDRIDADDIEEYQSAARACKSQSSDPIDLLVRVIAHAKKRTRDSRKESKTLTEVIEGSGLHSTTRPVTDGEIQSALAEEQRLFAAYTTACQTAAQPDVSVEARDAVMAQWNELASTLPALQNQIDMIEADTLFGPISDRDHELCTIRENIRTIAEMHHTVGATACSVCTSRVHNSIFTTTINNMMNANRQLEHKVKLDQEWRRLKADFNQKKQMGKGLIAQVSQIERALKNTVASVDPTELEVQYKAAMTRRQDLEQTLKSWLEIKRVQMRIEQADRCAARNASLSKSGETIMSELLEQAVDEFQDEVNRYLSDEFRLDIDLESDSCSFGLLRGGKFVTALSGAEWVKMLLAIGCAMSQGADFRIFTPEERAYDEGTLSDMMTTLSSAPGQVILTTTTEPSFIPPEWTVVRLSDKLPF